MVTRELLELLREQMDADSYEWLDEYIKSLEGLSRESLQTHLEAQRLTAAFCGEKVPGPVLKAINIIEAMIGDLDKPQDDSYSESVS